MMGKKSQEQKVSVSYMIRLKSTTRIFDWLKTCTFKFYNQQPKTIANAHLQVIRDKIICPNCIQFQMVSYLAFSNSDYFYGISHHITITISQTHDQGFINNQSLLLLSTYKASTRIISIANAHLQGFICCFFLSLFQSM